MAGALGSKEGARTGGAARAAWSRLAGLPRSLPSAPGAPVERVAEAKPDEREGCFTRLPSRAICTYSHNISCLQYKVLQ